MSCVALVYARSISGAGMWLVRKTLFPGLISLKNPGDPAIRNPVIVLHGFSAFQ